MMTVCPTKIPFRHYCVVGANLNLTKLIGLIKKVVLVLARIYAVLSSTCCTPSDPDYAPKNYNTRYLCCSRALVFH